MCGRLSLFAPQGELTERFDVTPVREIRPRYNVAPGQEHPVVRNDAPEKIHFPTWGLVPHWVDEFGGGHINARAETLADKPSFRDAYRERRCLVLADGFYDWKKTPTGKQPYRMTRTDGKPFAMAGLWEPWKNDEAQRASERSSGECETPSESLTSGEIAEQSSAVSQTPSGKTANGDPRDGEERTSFTVVTTEPNEVVGKIHHRMPVILAPEEESTWLTGDEDELKSVLNPFPARQMRAYPVSTKVNNPANDSPDIVEEVVADEDSQTGLGDFA